MRITAALIILAAWLTAFASAPGETGRTYHPLTSLEPDSVTLLPLDPAARQSVIEGRARFPDLRHSLRQSDSWGLLWGNYPIHYYTATLRPCSASYDPEPEALFLELNVEECDSTDPVRVLDTSEIYQRHGVNASASGANSLEVIVDHNDGLTEIFVGDHTLSEQFSSPLAYPGGIRSWAMICRGKSHAEVVTAVSEITREPDRSSLRRFSSADEISSYLAESTDPVEGIWKHLDYECDPEIGRLGGQYTVALVGDGKGGYDIIYLDGAAVGAGQWEPGMVRGHLSPTRFRDQYDLHWLDAAFREIKSNAHADIAKGVILSLHFPIYSTSVRFSKQ